MLCFFLLCCLSSATCSEALSRQRRSWIIDSFTIEEEHPGPFPYVLGKVNIERDYRVYFDLYGEGVDEEPRGVLSIHKDSGTIYVHKAVDYEERTMLKLQFEARTTDLSIDTKLGVEITIQDINDNPPHFQKDLYEISVKEEDVQGSHLLTVVASDRDQKGTANSTFHYEIKAVSPNTPDTEFVIEKTGAISFKGCLDHDAADMFTILVEAKDHGEVVKLSSSTTVVIHVQDGNNHLPSISGQTGSGKVKEGEIGFSPLRLHVTDKDTPHTPAWRARFTVHADEGGHFIIETDPDSNDGILKVVKALDFEEGAQRELSISVENELPYFSCQVKGKRSSGLWIVDTIRDSDPGAAQPHSVKVIINVEDTNDPPVFSVAVKEATVEENTPIGTWVEKVTAVDPDSSQARDFVYKVGNDPAGWVTVDPHTGDITTVKTPDRESSHVVNDVYTVLLHAVDKGEPPMTGTATLQIHVTDQNDNTPQPVETYLYVCMSDDPIATNITAFDLDENPFGGPFTFELLGDVRGKWKLNPSYGYTAGLVKEPSVYAGPHTVGVKISDTQGEFGVYNLSVTVCDCSVTGNCRTRRHSATRAASGAIGIVFASLVLLLFLLLMAVVCSCKNEFITLETISSGQTLLESNTEKPGTDCQVLDSVLTGSSEKKRRDSTTVHDRMQHTEFSKELRQSFRSRHSIKVDDRRENHLNLLADNCKQTTWNPFTANDYDHTHQYKDMGTLTSFNQTNSHVLDDTLRTLLHRKLSALQEMEDEMLDDELHMYADEGESHNLSELEAIAIAPDDTTFLKALQELDPKFNQLASICKPPHIQN
ncbi:cadherin 26 [Solea senegalensis]|uniref:Cadherin 26 n=1 Tax=Solea senegalensis TaxID=28829 RepID=A0AAV6QST4_SOLSE|nr:cadherin-like protein 26 [Solea senegalensis]KAG7495313.1 cadherin 26 [Solea senegalensis]